MSPRTTLTLDEDVAALLNRIVRERGISFKQAVNDTIRAGAQASQVSAKPFKVKARPLRRAPGAEHLNLDKALALAFELEDEHLLEVMGRARP
jgi:hypothetical protein